MSATANIRLRGCIILLVSWSVYDIVYEYYDDEPALVYSKAFSVPLGIFNRLIL